MVKVEEKLVFATPFQTQATESFVGVYKFEGQWNNKPFYVKSEDDNCGGLAMWHSGSARINSCNGTRVPPGQWLISSADNMSGTWAMASADKGGNDGDQPPASGWGPIDGPATKWFATLSPCSGDQCFPMQAAPAQPGLQPAPPPGPSPAACLAWH